MATGLFNLKQVNQAISQGAWSGYIAPKWVEYLVVAGGGGASSGGAGAGGLLTGVVTVAAGTSYSVTVGAGGASGITNSTAGANGAASVFGLISATGGGGSPNADTAANSGGSGSGAPSTSTSYFAGGQGVSGQGNAGGSASSIASPYPASGGGGAGTVGLNGSGSSTSAVAGNGGAGIASAITGTTVVYAGGGGGGLFGSATPGVGGVGGGGSGGASGGGAGTSGGGNTGGGGGGGTGSTYAGGSGGSGIVVVRYPGSVQFFTGGTLSYANGYMIHTFYASGTLAPTTPTPYVTDYQISRSLRFNAADSAYLTRTPASASNRKTFTFSGWIKRGKLDVSQYTIFSGGGGCAIRINDDSPGNQIRVVPVSGSLLIFTPVLRDPSAWYHIVVAVDTTQAVASERTKLYINNQLAPLTSGSYPSQNADSSINSTAAHFIGTQETTVQFYDGNMTEINFIDGQALTPSSFGYTNPATGVWSPLAFVGTYGTNGFELNFSDNSNTTAATLGKDYSGNGNNWTPNNFSVTAGAGNDSLVDSPTSYGTDTGVGGEVRGNYSTWNPLSLVSTALANGNLDASVTTAASPQDENVASTFAMSSGKWYCEIVSTSGSSPFIGIADASLQASARKYSSASVWSYATNGLKYNAGTGTSYGASWTTNDVMGIGLDMDAGTVTFYKNGASQGVAFSGLTGRSIVMWLSCGSGSPGNVTVYITNFGQRPFAYTAPSGFKALCTQNLPTPTIGATTATQAGKFFNPVLYTGTGDTQSVTGVGFAPDFTWIKSRSAAYVHDLFDTVRGAGKWLGSSQTNAEANFIAEFNSFDSNGFTVTQGGNIAANQNGYTYVAWNWKANGAGVTNTAGSITSTVSANTTSGFSVVTYTGNGIGASTVGHGIGIAPSMMIIKRRSTTAAWVVYHASLGPTQGIYLNLTDAAYTGSTFWNNTAPSSSVLTLGTVSENNVNGSTYVAYCFAPVAGYSAFGQYTGNGSSDGAFVYTGFRPAYVLIKRTTSAYDWWILDAARGTINAVKGRLYANAADAESTTYPYLDFLSNGFKLRDADGGLNASGEPYIYACFAQNPFKYSLAR